MKAKIYEVFFKGVAQNGYFSAEIHNQNQQTINSM